MTEFEYPECTTSVITSLAIFRKHHPDYRSSDIGYVLPPAYCLFAYLLLHLHRATIQKAVQYLHNAQCPEGGWFGSWAICYTYATQFALESLSLVGETYATSERVRKACRFLLDHQRKDGGWGESYKVGQFLNTYTVYPFPDTLMNWSLGMCGGTLDRPRGDPSRPNSLGSDGINVRRVSRA